MTDCLANFSEAKGWTRLYLRVSGALGKPSHTVIHRLVFRDKKAVRASVERVLEWDFDRIVLAHGNVVETGGREALREAFAWV